MFECRERAIPRHASDEHNLVCSQESTQPVEWPEHTLATP
jgi:hypothetical protein